MAVPMPEHSSMADRLPHATRWKRGLAMLCVGLLSCLALSTDVSAQSTPGLDTALNEAEFQAMLGRMSDQQVRDILIAEFAARRAEIPASGPGGLESLEQIGETLTQNASALIATWPQMGDAFHAVGVRLAEAGGVGLAAFALGLSLAAGFGVRHFWRQRASRRQSALLERNIDKGAYGSVATILDAAVLLVIELSAALAFAVTALAVLYVFFGHPDLRFFVTSYIAVVTAVLIVRSVVGFVFPLDWPSYRLIALSDPATQLVHRVVQGLAALWMFEAITSDVLARFGAPEGTPDLFSLLLGVVWIVLALTGTRRISLATTDVLPSPDDTGLSALLARNWATIAMAGLLTIWVVFTGGALVSGDVDVVAARIFQSMMVFAGLWTGYRILVHYLRAQMMDDAIRTAMGRAARSLLFAAGVLVVLIVWGLDPQTLAAGGTAGRLIQTVVNVGLTALVGWAIWEFVRTLIDVRSAAERSGDDDGDGEAPEGEGSLGASRTATLLPLLRSTALVVIGVTALFAALSSLGVNVAPLVAGAGVVGLAIGFGAQTLVKDVVSGVFFLIDDAFRRGEYIDLGTVKGTVERISVRSLQLRHHLGAVHTIPFGDISALTNYSRDWVIMKLPLRLTFDTDPQQVKKIIKQIGAEFMSDDSIGVGLLEPPKSQGVIQMEDSAMILRVKFKTLPGKQFTIRRELLHRIREGFEEAGIRFANREVTVHVNEDATPGERHDAIAAAASRAVDEAEAARLSGAST
jgi:small-conductance mechanosensitive channel